MGIPDHLTYLLRNLYAGQEATVRTRYATIDWFKIGKGVRQGCILSPCLFNLYTEYIMQNTSLNEALCAIKTAERNISNLRYADDIILIGTSQRWTKEPLDEGERWVWKSWPKTQHSTTKIMAAGPITSRQIAGHGNMGTVTGFIFLGSKITAEGDRSHEIKRCLLLGRKAMTNLDSILKGRDIILPTKFCTVKVMILQ